MKQRAGFTLIELLVVISIMGILAAILYGNLGQGGAQARDAQRKADLTNLQNAVERYKLENGRYPKGCNGVNGDAWSGENGTSFMCSDGTGQYIKDLAPEFIPALPTDPKPGSGDYGYAYRTNTEGTVYKIIARNSVETETVTDTSAFSPCDIVKDGSGTIVVSAGSTWGSCGASSPRFVTEHAEKGYCAYGICNVVNTTNSSCKKSDNYGRQTSGYSDCDDTNMAKTYGVWGGYGDARDVPFVPFGALEDDLKVECLTEKVICDLPPTTGWN